MSTLSNFQYRIYYQDTDAGGVVYHANYLNFFERARTDLFHHLSIPPSELVKTEKILFVIRKCEIDYLAPAKLDEVITVSVELKELGSSSMLFYQEIKLADKTLATLSIKVVCVDSESFKPKRISEFLRQKLLQKS